MPLNLGGCRECENYKIHALKILRNILLGEYSETFLHNVHEYLLKLYFDLTITKSQTRHLALGADPIQSDSTNVAFN